jgi:hypothetical protein
MKFKIVIKFIIEKWEKKKKTMVINAVLLDVEVSEGLISKLLLERNLKI